MDLLLALLMTAIGAPAPAPAADQHPAALVGHYDGHQIEMGAQLLLEADGRFRYGVAYGALDEEAEGTWIAEGDHVLLTSDTVTPPRFVFLGQKAAPARTVKLSVDAPQSISLQYFTAVIWLAKGYRTGGRLTGDGLTLPFGADDPPAQVQLFLAALGQKSEMFAIDPAKGYWLSFRFEPNDFGKVDFRGEALAVDKGDLVLERLGRTIRFHHDKGESGG